MANAAKPPARPSDSKRPQRGSKPWQRFTHRNTRAATRRHAERYGFVP